jgi:hypothetical protein
MVPLWKFVHLVWLKIATANIMPLLIASRIKPTEDGFQTERYSFSGANDILKVLDFKK